jgi:hypothetical protein
MTIKSKQLFVLIGNDRTGKTTLQKLLIEKICGYAYEKLPTNKIFDILHPEIKRKYRTISFGNRSYQEKKDDYGTVDEYFQNHFQAADISFISSHLSEADIRQMISNGRQRFYNVNGIFLTNSIESSPEDNSQISLLDWDERFVIENQTTADNNQIDRQLNSIADSIVFLLANRTSVS